VKASERAAIVDAISRGCPPYERLSDSFAPAFDADRAGEKALRNWFDLATAKTAGARAALTNAIGLPDGDLSRAFGPVVAAEGQRPPEWAKDLEVFLSFLPPSAKISDDDPSQALAEVLVPAAKLLLDWNRLAAQHHFISTSVLAHLTLQLATRVLITCWSVLELEAALQGDPILDIGRDAWVQRLSGFSGLSFVIGTALRQWRQNALEIISRLATDFTEIGRVFFAEVSPGRLVSITCDCGDRHGDGRAVAILGFDSGQRVVYKPKDLRCAKILLQAMQVIDAKAELRFSLRQILCRRSYAWEEYVPEQQSTSGSDAGDFFRSYGGLLRLLQFVEARDFWMDNLRVNGKSPVFIDLECILHPRIKCPRHLSPAARLALDAREESALSTAAVSHRVMVEDGSFQEFGGLSAPGVRKLPFAKWKGYRDRTNGTLSIEDGQIYWDPKSAWPLVDGHFARAVDFLTELESGYLQVNAVLRQHAAEFIADDGPFALAGEAPVRAILRSTWDYLNFLRASLEATALLDGVARELALAPVLNSCPQWGADGDMTTRNLISLTEINSLRQLDIPEFHSLPADAAVILPGGDVIEGVFEGTACDRLKRRCDHIDRFDAATELQAIGDAVRQMQVN
jgi:lantibiotic modifying enzyme